MRRLAMTMIGLAALALSACSAPGPVTRDAPIDLTPRFAQNAESWSLERLEVIVPETLTVSEANSIKPRADIVWRDDPFGDRHEQVATVIEDAMNFALRPLDGATPVVVEIAVTRFHALTERARYTIGGEHEIEFVLTVRHAQTGQALSGPREIDLTFRALGGRAAVQSEQQGIGQKERIQSHLIHWAREEFGAVPQVSALVY